MTKDNYYKSKFFNGDIIILIVALLLSLISIYAVSSSSREVYSQLKHIFYCYLFIYIFYKIDYRNCGKFAFIALIGGGILYILTVASGDKRSINIGNHSIQTFYLIGFLVIFYISKQLALIEEKGMELSLNRFMSLLAVVIFFCLAIAPFNNSTAIILLLTSIVVFFLGKVPSKYFLRLVGSVALAGTILLLILCSDSKISNELVKMGRLGTVKSRITMYICAKKDIRPPNTDNYRQLMLAKAAIARSAWSPTGPGKGVIKKSLAENDTDFVYATIVEELGLAIGMLIILLYLILFFRAMQLAKRCSSSPFGKLLSAGIGFWFACQALVHIGANCELMPATGQTLPMISSGGASLIFSGIMLGILLNISKNFTEPEK